MRVTYSYRSASILYELNTISQKGRSTQNCVLNSYVASCIPLLLVSLHSTELCRVNVTFMDKVNLKYVPNNSSSSHNNNNNNPKDVLKVVKISPLQDF